MSPSVDDLQSQWLAQLSSMREAIAELKLDQRNGEVQAYGHDIVVDEDVTGDSGSEDPWDVWSDEEETEESSDFVEEFEEDHTGLAFEDIAYNQDWLEKKCHGLATANSGLNAGQLKEHLSALLASDMQGISSMPTCLRLGLRMW